MSPFFNALIYFVKIQLLFGIITSLPLLIKVLPPILGDLDDTFNAISANYSSDSNSLSNNNPFIVVSQNNDLSDNDENEGFGICIAADIKHIIQCPLDRCCDMYLSKEQNPYLIFSFHGFKEKDIVDLPLPRSFLALWTNTLPFPFSDIGSPSDVADMAVILFEAIFGIFNFEDEFETPEKVFSDNFVRVHEFGEGDIVNLRIETPESIFDVIGSWVGVWSKDEYQVVNVNVNKSHKDKFRIEDFTFDIKNLRTNDIVEQVPYFDLAMKQESITIITNNYYISDIPEENDVASFSKIKSSLIVFTNNQMGINQGYSKYLSQYWVYKSGAAPVPKSLLQKQLPNPINIPQDIKIPWIPIDVNIVLSFKPLEVVASIFCENRNPKDFGIALDNSLKQDSDVLICGKSIAIDKMQDIFGWNWQFTVKTIVVAFFVTASTLYTLFISFMALFPQAFLVYVVSNLFRHVDTPLSSVSKVLEISFSTLVPYTAYGVLMLVLAEMLRDGVDQVNSIFQYLHTFVEISIKYRYIGLLLWAFITSYFVVFSREKAGTETQDVVIRERIERFKRVARQNSRDFEAEKQTREETETFAYADHTQRINENLCRICRAGTDEGKLIRPCLCSGTIAYVHLPCLNQWRRSSDYVKSLTECEQCGFRYSISRSKIAVVTRSSVFLLLITCIFFFVLLISCSILLMIIESLFLSENYFSSFFFDTQATANAIGGSPSLYVTPTGETISQSDLSYFNLAIRYGTEIVAILNGGFLRLHLSHYLASIILIGIFGFLSFGYFTFPLFWENRRNNSGGRSGSQSATSSGALMESGTVTIIVLIGVVRVLVLIYSRIKKITGVLLDNFENRVEDIQNTLLAEIDTTND